MRLFCVLLLSLFLTTCQDSPEFPANRFAEKHEPSEQFFLQRSYPDGQFSMKTYTTALQQASKDLQYPTQKSGIGGSWETQGPGNIGGRINAIATHPTNNSIIFLGYSAGGIFKSVNGGEDWYPVFDDKPFTAIGDITFDPVNPDIIYAGTGDPNISGYPFIGNGIYKSTDGGETWINMGLEETRIISRIVVHPFNTNIIYAATMGIPFERNQDRGVYRSLNGGASWEKILFIAPDAGVIDLILDPDEPRTLYAAGWNRIRNNSESSITGSAAKVFRTKDGGDHWEILDNDLPQENTGRIGLALFSPRENRPNDVKKLYALYVGANSNLQAIYSSSNDGDSWTEIPTDESTGLNANALGGFGWFFGQIRVHPNPPGSFNEPQKDLFYLLGVDLWKYENDFWSLATPAWFTYDVHADKHDLVFNKSNHLYLATDGGAYRSFNGSDWHDLENIATTQFYRIAYNPHQPDIYYGGAQDNGTLGGNQDLFADWERIYGSDGFQPVFNPNDPDVFYVETQNGGIAVTSDNGSTYMNGTNGISDGDRRNWDMPYMMNPLKDSELYAGTYRIYKSTAGVVPNWNVVSEDLTDGINDRYHTITTVQCSPLIDELVYVGTSDANVWRSENGGDDWEAIHTDQLPERYVTDIKASPNMDDNVYVSFSGYKDNDFNPHLYRSTNRGNTWENIGGNLPMLSINDIYVLPNRADSVLFVGTDGGVYATLDAGVTWDRVGDNMPIIPVYDLEFNPVQNQLVAGTFARSIMTYPLDSLVRMDEVTSTFTPTAAITEPALKVFPNPVSERMTISFKNNEKNKTAEIVVLNELGQVVYQAEEKKKGIVEMNVDVSSWIPGIYFVKVKVRHQVMNQRIIIL